LPPTKPDVDAFPLPHSSQAALNAASVGKLPLIETDFPGSPLSPFGPGCPFSPLILVIVQLLHFPLSQVAVAIQ
jgi:hypothetical protein